MVVACVPPCGGIRLRGGLVSVRDGLVAGFCELLMSQGGKWPKPLSGGGRDPTRRRVGKEGADAWDVCVRGCVQGGTGPSPPRLAHVRFSSMASQRYRFAFALLSLCFRLSHRFAFESLRFRIASESLRFRIASLRIASLR